MGFLTIKIPFLHSDVKMEFRQNIFLSRDSPKPHLSDAVSNVFARPDVRFWRRSLFCVLAAKPHRHYIQGRPVSLIFLSARGEASIEVLSQIL